MRSEKSRVILFVGNSVWASVAFCAGKMCGSVIVSKRVKEEKGDAKF